ncbi:hypothetical protein HMPREF1143_0464 [Peptoanaerobacter stomatis]|uniref:Uncharacterized protein n=1 Tax=Peptoanaerobacter stomatis TaxID=796937 RepID=J6HH87_9FIRM|nr:hypothetical protein [Peptoanaerobacter stomatis]EJU22053.1 hypothetical protein HMPREF1143_0464 [Peptoanaerobacter stomatis]
MDKKINNSMFVMTNAEYKNALKSLKKADMSNLKNIKNSKSMFTTKEIYEAFNKAFEKRNEEVYGKKSSIYCN